MNERSALHFSTAQLETFCQQVRNRERSPADALRALTTLQSFLSAMGQEQAHRTVTHELLERHCEQLRAAVLAQAARDITVALHQQSAAALATCHGRLSRSGYAQAAGLALAHETRECVETISGWLRQWLEDAAKRSGNLPDAVDFRSAGITPGEYQAMRDLHAALSAGRG